MTDTYDPNGPRPRHEYVPTIATRAAIYVESFSDGSTEWQHDYPQDDWDGRICNVDRDDNTWAEPERLTDTEIVKRIVDILHDPENSEECVDQVQMICFLLDSQGYPTPD
jgi:hypothetical protein